jgi:hypothetical protein
MKNICAAEGQQQFTRQAVGAIHSPAAKDVSMEIVEEPLLEPAEEQRLVKTQQTEKA